MSAAFAQLLPHPTRWRHVVGYMLSVYRREWQGSLFSAFIEPLVILAGLGIGLGVLVGNRAESITGGVSYVAYIAPALMASSAMTLGASEASWPILARIQWVRVYHAILATPLNAADVMVGAIAFMGGKLLFTAAFFAAVLFAFGIAANPLGAVATVAATALTGLAFAAPVTAYSVTRQNDQGFAFVFRMIITPLGFFSGTYFPIENLPLPAQAIAWLTPLAHGVALDRAFALGRPLADAWLHIAVLLAWAIGGTAAAAVLFRRRMLK